MYKCSLGLTGQLTLRKGEPKRLKKLFFVHSIKKLIYFVAKIKLKAENLLGHSVAQKHNGLSNEKLSGSFAQMGSLYDAQRASLELIAIS